MAPAIRIAEIEIVWIENHRIATKASSLDMLDRRHTNCEGIRTRLSAERYPRET